MQKLVSCFCLTDGRPWYKQVVSGIYIFLAIAIISPFAFLAISIPVVAFSEVGFGGVALFLVKGAGALSAALICFGLLVAGWRWASEDYDS